MKILITDGDTRAALSATRSLAKKGYSVYIVGRKKYNISSISKCCTKGFSIVSYTDDIEGFLDGIKRIIVQEAIEIVLPMTDASVIMLAELRDRLGSGVMVACPPIDVVRKLCNKYELFKLAEKKNIEIPKTVFINNRNDFFSKDLTEISFPVVVKPSFSKIQTQNGFITTAVEFAGDRSSLNELYTTRKYLEKYPSLIQEKIEGPGTGLFTLFDGEKHLALFSHKRLREKPPWGGVSVYSESVSLDPEMVESSRLLLSDMGWQGIAMVEFKRDHRDGKAKLIEINGRFWGSLELAIICRINFPSLYIDYLTGKDVKRPKDYLKGKRLKWILGDLDNHLIRIKSGEESFLNLIVEFFKIKDCNTSFDVLKTDDIKPFLLESKEYIFDILRLNQSWNKTDKN